MKSDIVIDTSAIIAVILGEPLRKEVLKVTTGVRTYAPHSVYYEIGKVLLRSLRQRELSTSELSDVIDSFLDMNIEYFDVQLGPSVLRAYQTNGTAFDAYVLQCAVTMKLPVLTLDNPLKAIAFGCGIPVVNL